MSHSGSEKLHNLGTELRARHASVHVPSIAFCSCCIDGSNAIRLPSLSVVSGQSTAKTRKSGDESTEFRLLSLGDSALASSYDKRKGYFLKDNEACIDARSVLGASNALLCLFRP